MTARYVQPLRILIQFCLLGFMLWIGVRFYWFADQLRSGAAVSTAARPVAVEGFLPISGLVGLTAWAKGLGFTRIHPAAVVILLTVLALAFGLRRSFCSWVCPVATVSECLWKLGYRLMKRNPRLPGLIDRFMRGLKYLVLGFFLWSICLAMPPAALEAFLLSDYHKVADIRLLDFFMHISLPALGFILTLTLLSLPLRNPFCRYICPYGALLGLVAILSPVRVTRDTSRCVSCGICSQVCPTGIDVMNKPSVASPECIGCWRCVSHCRFNEALSMRVAGRYAIAGVVFALLVLIILWGGSMVGKLSGHWLTPIDASEYRRLLAP